MGNTVIGIILIVLGVIALFGGIAGGVAKLFLDIKNEVKKGAAGNALTDLLPTELIKALTEFLKALTAAPQWLALTVIGILLIGLGSTYL